MSLPLCGAPIGGYARCVLDRGHPGEHGVAPGPLVAELELQAALREVEAEARRAMAKQPPFNSAHEGWAVIREEEDELWEHVRDNTGRSPEARGEAMQTAAMAIRYMVDIATGEE